MQFQNGATAKTWGKTEKIIFLTSAPYVYSRERKSIEIKFKEEYCWAIIHAMWRACCGRSCSKVQEFGFQLDSLCYARVGDQMQSQFQLDSLCYVRVGDRMQSQFQLDSLCYVRVGDRMQSQFQLDSLLCTCR